MLPQYDNSRQSMYRVKAFLAPGTLGAKKSEIDAILIAGDTLYFQGEVSWCVEVDADSKVLKGHSESLDHAFADIESILFMLSEEFEDDIAVNCSLQSMGER